MSNKTIAKFSSLVIFVVCGWMLASACSHASSSSRSALNSSEASPDWQKPVVVGRIASADVRESSGLADSPCQPNVFWTHNDNGDEAFIFAMTPTGKHLGTWRVAGARNDDWEDMAAYKAPDGTSSLYIGDIGNNKLERPDLRVYRVREPVVSDATATSNEKNPLQTEAAEMASFKYSGTPHNAETLMVQPQTADVYVLTKRLDGPSLVFKFKPQFGSATPETAQKIAEVAMPAVPNGLLTGGAISPDGKRVILCDYSSGYELILGDSVNFDEIWKSRPVPVDLSDRKQGEAVTFSPDGRSIFATSEKKNAEIVEVRRR